MLVPMSAHKPSPPEVVVEFYGPHPVGIEQLAATHLQEITIIESKGFAATDYTLQVLFAASAGGGIIRAVVAIIKAHIESKQHVTIKAGGVELAGLSAKDAERILEHLRTNGELPEKIGEA